MENHTNRSLAETDQPDCRRIMEWMAEAGITVDLVESPGHACPACRPVDLDAAA